MHSRLVCHLPLLTRCPDPAKCAWSNRCLAPIVVPTARAASPHADGCAVLLARGVLLLVVLGVIGGLVGGLAFLFR